MICRVRTQLVCFSVFLSLITWAAPGLAEIIVPDTLSLSSVVGRKSVPATSERLNGALKDFQSGNYDETLDRLEKAFQANKQLPPARLMLARMFLAVGRLDPVAGLLEQVARDHPDYPGTYNTMGDLALRQGRTADAFAQFTLVRFMLDRLDASKRKNFDLDCLLGLAAVAEVREQWDLASKHLAAAMERDDSDGRVHYRLGIAEFHRGDATAALAHMQRGRAIDETLPIAELALSRLHEQTGDAEQAGQWIEKAVAAHPKDASVRTSEAGWLLRQGRDQEAYEAAREAMTLAPGDRNARYTLGIAARQLHSFDEAAGHFQAIFAESPGDLEALNQLALCLAEHADAAQRRQALQLAQSLVRQAPQDRRAYATLGWCHYRNGHLQQAKQALMTSISGGEGPAASGYYLACVMRDLGETEKIPMLLAGAAAAQRPFLYMADVQEWQTMLDR